MLSGTEHSKRSSVNAWKKVFTHALLMHFIFSHAKGNHRH